MATGNDTTILRINPTIEKNTTYARMELTISCSVDCLVKAFKETNCVNAPITIPVISDIKSENPAVRPVDARRKNIDKKTEGTLKVERICSKENLTFAKYLKIITKRPFNIKASASPATTPSIKDVSPAPSIFIVRIPEEIEKNVR